MQKHQLYLVDASIYIFRAYFSMPDSIRDKNGNPCNALYGYTLFLLQLIQRHGPTHIAVAFDESLTSSFRNKIYPDYKANRELPPDDLALQMRRCKKVTEMLGLACYSSKKYEADDLIGSIANKMRKRCKMVYVTADKDLLQLMQPGDEMLNFAKDYSVNFREVKKHIGVKASQVIDLLALMGDAVDNIPGATGIGKKTATALLEAYKGVDDIYARLSSVADMELRGARGIMTKLESSRQLVEISYQLASIVEDAPIEANLSLLKRQSNDTDALCRYLDSLRFSRTISNRVRSILD